jgi:hypothetical protein
MATPRAEVRESPVYLYQHFAIGASDFDAQSTGQTTTADQRARQKSYIRPAKKLAQAAGGGTQFG